MQALKYAIKMGLACGCEITKTNYYDRKNYFYPDLPKGYQITQDKTPICKAGGITVKTPARGEQFIALNRIHLEEDAGKSMHLDGEVDTLVDLNRAGVPLIEIVTEPVMRHPEEAYAYLTEVRKLVRYLEICDGNMQEGSLRCDANISVRKRGDTAFGKKVEVKNMNSIRNVQRAIEHEFERQIELIEGGEEIISETRSFEAQTGTTFSLRMKEELNDYRYFPDPDLTPVVLSRDFIKKIEKQMPSLPSELLRKFKEEYDLPEYDAGVLSDTKEIGLYFDEVCRHTKNYKSASNWVMGPIKAYLNEQALTLDDFPLSAKTIAEIIALVDTGKLSFSVASQNLFAKLLKQPNAKPIELAKEHNLIQDTSEELIKDFIADIIEKYPDKVTAYKNGKKGLLGLFMGELMRATKGKADPKKASQMLKEVLDTPV